MKMLKYIAVPTDPELLAAIQRSAEKSGRKLGPEAAHRLRKSYRVGPFARKETK